MWSKWKPNKLYVCYYWDIDDFAGDSVYTKVVLATAVDELSVGSCSGIFGQGSRFLKIWEHLGLVSE